MHFEFKPKSGLVAAHCPGTQGILSELPADRFVKCLVEIFHGPGQAVPPVYLAVGIGRHGQGGICSDYHAGHGEIGIHGYESLPVGVGFRIGYAGYLPGADDGVVQGERLVDETSLHPESGFTSDACRIAEVPCFR